MYSINKKKPEKIRRYLIYPLTEGIVLAVIALCLTSVTAYFIYHHALSAIKAEIQDGLLRTASGIAACLDGDTIASFDSPEKKDLPEYHDTIALLQKARLATKHCTYLYINRMASGSIVFIVDPTPIDEDGKPIFTDEQNLEPSIPMTPYPNPSKELIEALNKQTSIVTPDHYTDQWGSFYSAYIPLYDSNKKFIGTLGADLKIDDMLARCQPIEEATKRAFFVSCILAMLFGTLIWFTRRFSLQLNESRFALLENFFIAKEFADQSSARIGRQLDRIAQIFRNISRHLEQIATQNETDKLQMLLNSERNKLSDFAEKLADVGKLKFSKRTLELGNFELTVVEKNLQKQLQDCCENSANLTIEADKDIPDALYGSLQTFEELLGQMGQFFLKMFENPVLCRIQMLYEGNRDIIIRQSMTANIEGIDRQRLELLQNLCKEAANEDFFEDLELAEAVSVSIVRELIYLLNSDIKVKIENNQFSISFESAFQKAVEEMEEEEE